MQVGKTARVFTTTMPLFCCTHTCVSLFCLFFVPVPLFCIVLLLSHITVRLISDKTMTRLCHASTKTAHACDLLFAIGLAQACQFVQWLTPTLLFCCTFYFSYACAIVLLYSHVRVIVLFIFRTRAIVLLYSHLRVIVLSLSCITVRLISDKTMTRLCHEGTKMARVCT